MTTLPTGTVTFLFTDIEGSTRLAQQYPSAWPAAQSRHHAILKSAIESHRGYVFQVIGDAFCASFHTAPDALAAALDAQRALQGEAWAETPINVRMGMHTGAAEARDGDYQGYLTLALAQRVMSTAYGRQTLASNATAGLLSGKLPDGVMLRDMGEHRLKGLLNPERLWQVSACYLSSDFPPLQSLNAIPNNLPIQVTSFIGRERELNDLQRLLPTTRLLTLTGAGGTGKTRLSLQVAADVLDGFKDGAWFVELAPLTDPALVPGVIASALGVREEPGRPIQATLMDYLRNKHLLLVLDNCEHLIDACARFADAVMHASRETRILASSREALGIAGELAYRVPSLQMPDPAQAGNIPIDQLTQYEALRLFIERATFAQPTFAVTMANAPAVAQICYRLDGIPLALELAAARLKGLPVEKIAERLDDRFRLLTGGSRTALPRQQTLRGAIDWSHSLLPDNERTLLRRLSVFAGGWTLEAAEAVCATDGIETGDILDLLSRLVDKSLVLLADHGVETRYRLLETIRQYARDKLLESGEGEPIRTRHLDYFVALAEAAAPWLHGPEQREWFARLELEHDNLRGALEWSARGDDVDKGMRLAYALLWFWEMQAYWNEGRESAETLLAQPQALPKSLTRANTLFTAAVLLGRLPGPSNQQRYLAESIGIAREQGGNGKRTLALCLGLAGEVIIDDDLDAAQSMIVESLALAQSLGDPWVVALTLYRAGSFAVSRLDHESAHKQLEASHRLFETIGDRRWAARVSHIIAMEDVRESRDFAGARLRYEKLLPFFRDENDRPRIASALNVLGVLAHAEGDFGLAKSYYREALDITRDLGGNIFSPAKNLGCILLYEGDVEHARTLFAECMSVARQGGDKAMLAYAIQSYASMAAVDNHARKAVALFAATRKLQHEAADKTIISPAGDADFARNLAIARGQVDDSTFDAAWAAGYAMSCDEAIAYALEGTDA